MSKKLIAGAGVVASFAIALAPLATFAATATYESDTHNDTLKITVAPACAFGNVAGETVDKGVSHTVGSANTTTDAVAGAWTPSDDTTSNGLGRVPDKADGSYGTNDANISTDTFAYSIYAGTTRDDMATTSLKIYCNTANGYTLKAATANLKEWNATTDTEISGGKTINAATGYSASVSGYAISSVNVGSTGATTEYASNKFANTTAAEIAHKESAAAETGDTITMTYGIGVAPNQKAALYEGTVTYTLFQGFGN